MQFKEIFKLSVGQVALIMFGPLLLIPFIGTFGILAFYLFLALWLYNLGVELFPLLPQGHKLNLWRFKFYFFAMLLCAFNAAYKMYLVIYSDLSFDYLAKIAPLLNILILFFLLNTMYFIAKEIIFIKDNKTEVSFADSIGVFISFWLLPFVIGILFLQPTIKSIFEKQSKKETDGIDEELEPEEIIEELINYTIHKYKCSEGELIISQELHQPNIGEDVLLNGSPAPTGKYKIGFLQTIIVVDGKVAIELPTVTEDKIIPAEEKKEEKTASTFTKHTYQCNEGELVIEQEFQMPNYGEAAYLDGKPAPTGSYEIGFLRSVFISEGKVSQKTKT